MATTKETVQQISSIHAKVNGEFITKAAITLGQLKQNAKAFDLRAVVELLSKIPSHITPTVILTVDTLDGRGDFEHFRAFAQKIKSLFPRINLIGIIGVYGTNVDLCNVLIHYLNSPDTKNILTQVGVIFNKGRIKAELGNYNDLPKTEQTRIEKAFSEYSLTTQLLDKYSESLCGIFQISIGNNFCNKSIKMWLYDKCCSGLPYFYIAEYGSPATADTTGIEHCYPMYISENGIRLIEEFEGDVTAERRIQTLLSISDKVFLHALLFNGGSNNNNANSLSTVANATQTTDIKENHEYFQTRKFFPAYLQGELSLTLFILTQIETYGEALKSKKLLGLDFHVSEKHLNQTVLSEYLLSYGFTQKDWAVISESDLSTPKLYPIRIFNNKIKNDEDYQKIYFFANDSAAGSGDDSFTIVLSSLNIPFLANYLHLMKQDFIIDAITTFEKIECRTLAQYLRIFREEIDYAAPGQKTPYPVSLLWNIQSCKDKFSTNMEQLFCANVPYPTFQKELIKLYAQKLGKFVRENEMLLRQDLVKMREHLFAHANIFSSIPKWIKQMLEYLMMHCSKSKLLTLSASNQSKLDTETLILSLNNLTSPKYGPEPNWKYSEAKKRYWLQVSKEDLEKEPYKVLIAKGLLTASKVKDKTDYVLLARKNLIEEVTQIAQLVLSGKGDMLVANAK